MSARQNSQGEEQSCLDDWSEAEYQAALERVSRSAGADPGEFRRRIAQSAERLRLTPECVTIAEVEQFPRFADLPARRQAHVSECGTCAEFLVALEPRPGELAVFLAMAKEARSQTQGRHVPGLAQFFGFPNVELRPALVGAATAWVVALMAAVPLYRAFVEKPNQVAAVVETFTSDKVVLAAVPNDQLLLSKDESLVAGAGIESIDAAARQVLNNALAVRNETEDKRLMSVILAREDLTKALQAAPNIQAKSLEPVDVPLTAVTRLANIWLSTARFACEKTPVTTDTVRTSFDNLLAKNSGQVDSWGSYYLTIHQQVKEVSAASISGEPSSPSQAETLSRLRLCGEFLRRGAILRYQINALPKDTQLVSLPADSAASLSLGMLAGNERLR